MYVFPLLWWPEKEKMAHKKNGLKNVCFCSVSVAREGKINPQEEELNAVLCGGTRKKMSHKKRSNWYFFAVFWWPKKEKMAHKKKELKNVCFCSVVVAREGKINPQEEELNAVLCGGTRKKMSHKKRSKRYFFAVFWWPKKEKMAHKKKELKNV
jgi:hypothetical protein